MRNTGFLRWALPIAVCAALGGSAHAQNEGYQLNRLAPAPAGDPFALVDFPQFSSEYWLATRLTFDYSKDSINVDGPDEEGNPLPAPIGHTQYARFGVAGTLWGRLGLTLEIPMLLFESGTEFSGIGPSGTVLSDPRVGIRGLLFGDPTGTISMSAALDAWLPIGSEESLAGDKDPRLLPKLILGGMTLGDRLRWAVNAGYYVRSTAFLSSQVSPIGNTVGSEVRLAAGASYLAMDGKLSVGPELTVALAVQDRPEEQGLEISELFATGRYAISEEMSLGLGVGTAVAGSPGPPDARAMLTFSYSPRRSQRVASSFEMVVLVPDEDGHIGAIEVDDGKTKTVLDEAYASTELSKKDKVARAITSSPEALAQRTEALAKVMPPVDWDSDGVPDQIDACPGRPGDASDDALRNGCPPAVEKIVVLPDEDGTVGAVEVDDGTSITLVDKAYASAEVGSTGKATAVVATAETEKALEKAVAVVAEVLPPADVDQDGVRDGEDACPDRKGEKSLDPLRNGCPPASERIVVLPDADGHVGAIEIDDGKTKIVVDKAYASAEVSKEGTATVQEPTSSPVIVEKAIAEVAAVLPPADGDEDGVADADDACPGRKGVASLNKKRNGCPEAAEVVVIIPDEDGHVGSLEIDDGTTKTVLDKAFATSEVGKDGKVLSVPSAPSVVVMRGISDVSEIMPRADIDGDGIIDAHDGCSNRKGIPHVDPARHGCPRAVETIVLLEDEDGHVGAIEVGEGDAMVLLDKAQATLDVGEDGGVIASETPKQLVEKDFADAIAIAQAAKKKLNKSAGRVQFTVYFDEKAVPTRDVDAQIEALMEELNQLDDYSIEVVGHTDATGSNRANLRVGLARASEIAKRLEARGVATHRVGASTRGSSEPAVEVMNPTKVPEKLNRRVEIRIKDPGLPQLVVPYSKSTRTTRDMRGEYKALGQRLKGRADLRIVVVGHTDSTETQRNLAQKRADGVARQLTRAGIPKENIEIISKDATDPEVEAEAGKPQPENRRVEIFVNTQ